MAGQSKAQDLTAKTALVTGAASGIGRAIAKALAAQGVSVSVCDLNESAARAVVAEIEQARGHALALQADVSNPSQVRAAVKMALDRFGRLDILVNNAGLQFIAPVHEFPEDKWNLLIGVMLTGAFLCTKYTLPSMIAKRWGRIVNISSIHGLIASPFKSAYIAAKHGIIGLTKTVALEVGEYGITANAVCPSYVRTPLVEGQVADQAKIHGIPPNEVIEKVMLGPAVVKRLLEPEEIAALVLYLCSDAAAGVTGSAYTIDGGWTAR